MSSKRHRFQGKFILISLCSYRYWPMHIYSKKTAPRAFDVQGGYILLVYFVINCPALQTSTTNPCLPLWVHQHLNVMC